MAEMTLRPITSYVKDVRRNRETWAWDAYVVIDNAAIYLGSRQYSWDAESLCDEYVYAQFQQQPRVVAETDEAGVIVERKQTDDADPTAWTDYRSGCVLLGVKDNGDPADLIIHGCEICGIPITFTTLAGIYSDLGQLLADPRVRAKLPAGDMPVWKVA